MTFYLKTFAYRNESNTATVLVCNYIDKFDVVSYWEILIQYDGRADAETIAHGLKNKPSRERIGRICEEY